MIDQDPQAQDLGQQGMIDQEPQEQDLGRAGNHLKHGGAGALKRIQEGKELVGLAAIEERNIEAELAQPGGRKAIVQKQAQRLEACARLYWNAVCTAFEAKDIVTATNLVKTWGWVQASAVRAMLAIDQVGDDWEQLSFDGLLGKGAGNED